MTHDSVLGDPGDVVPLYLAGALPPDERRAFEAHLRSGCAACEAELRRLRDAADALARGIAPIAPDPSTRQRLLGRIAGPSSSPPDVGARARPRREAPRPRRDQVTRRAARARWRPAGVAGVEVRMLHADPDRDRVTALVRMGPGGKLPAHVHTSQEEIFLVEGDLRTADDVLQAGDYQLSLPGSHHAEATSDRGCVALIVMPLSALGGYLATDVAPAD